MHWMNTLATAAALAVAGTAASAATVTPTTGPTPGALNFSTAIPSGGGLVVGDFLFTPTNTTSGSGAGNCGPAGGTCLQFNSQQTTTMTTNPAGGMFNLSSLSFVLDGQPSELSVFNLSFGAPGTLIITADVTGNGGNSCTPSATRLCASNNTWYDLNFEGAANNVTSLLFDNTGTANVRIGNIVASTVPQPAPVPLPASALLLAGGVGGLAALRRRRKAA